jgi:hypothetical protein
VWPHLEEVGKDFVREQATIAGGYRLIKTHFPYGMTPMNSKAKYIFVARNPKDCVVSFYHHTGESCLKSSLWLNLPIIQFTHITTRSLQLAFRDIMTLPKANSIPTSNSFSKAKSTAMTTSISFENGSIIRMIPMYYFSGTKVVERMLENIYYKSLPFWVTSIQRSYSQMMK